MSSDESASFSRLQPAYLTLCGFVCILTAGIWLYSQTMAFAWDEGFHALTAKLIASGKEPYADFNFSQTPLNAYWNSLLIRWFGPNWYAIHGAAALFTSGAVFLIMDFVYSRMEGWRATGAFVAACAMGLCVSNVEFGTIAQAYGLCLLTSVVGFRVTVASVGLRNPLVALAAGMFSAAAAAASLLTAPVCPVLFLWLLFANRAGNRLMKAALFVAGAVIPFVPVIRLYLLAPQQTLFNIIQYNLLFRQVEWQGAIAHDVGVWLSWVDSGQAILFLLLGVAALIYMRHRDDLSKARKREYYLCAFLWVALVAHISSAHPTFPRYYLLASPYASILAVLGLRLTAGHLHPAGGQQRWAAAVFAVLFALDAGAMVFEHRQNLMWKDMENVAAKVDEVTPKNGTLLADEFTFFLTGRPVPTGMELADSHKLEFPPERAKFLHLVGRIEMKRRVLAGEYDTVETCSSDDWTDSLNLDKLYSKQAEIQTCEIYWQRSAALQKKANATLPPR